MGNFLRRLIFGSVRETNQSSHLLAKEQEHTQKYDEEFENRGIKDSESVQPSQSSQHLPDTEQPREIGEQKLRRNKDLESTTEPNQAAVSQFHAVEEKEEKAWEQESQRNKDSDATESVQTNQCSKQLPEKEQELKTGEQGLRRDDSDPTESLQTNQSSQQLTEKKQIAEQETPSSKDSDATESTAEPNQSVHAVSHLPAEKEKEHRTREQEPRSNKDSDANVSTTEPKQQRLDEEFGEKYDKQSSLKVVDKLNPSKELNKEKGELQHAQEQFSGAAHMQAIGHQVVGSEDKSHEDVKLMYEKFFGGEAVRVKRVLKKQMGSIQTRALLHQTFQVIYDNVQQMLVEHLLKSPALVGEVLTDQNIKDQVRETKANDDRQRIFQAFKTRKIMAGADQGEWLKQAVQSLFRVTNIFSSGGDANLQVEMRENQVAFGILLQTCGLIKGGIETKIKDTINNLDESSLFSAVENFEQAKSLAGKLLDTYINGGIRLAWMMVTRIPPMIPIERKEHEPRFTTLEPCCDEDDDACIFVPLRPILFFSYEGQVAVEGIVAKLPSKKLNENAIDPPGHQKKQLSFHE